MNGTPTRVLLLSLLLTLSACEEEMMSIDDFANTQGAGSPVIARVGDELIFASDVEAELRNLPASMQAMADTPEMRRRIEELLIRRAVLSQQAVTQGLDVKPEIHAQIRRLRDDILIDAVKSQFLNNLPIPEESVLREYYENHQEEFAIPEQIHAAHILLRDEEEAKRIAALLRKDPEQFSALAARYSLDDGNKSRGGDLNWFPRGVMSKPFEEAAFALKNIGDISEPVQSESGWHIIQLKGRRPASVQSFEDARREIVHILQHQAFEEWVEKLIRHADIQRTKTQLAHEDIRLPEGIGNNRSPNHTEK